MLLSLALVLLPTPSQTLIEEGGLAVKATPASVSCMGKALTADGKPWTDALILFESPLPPESEARTTPAPIRVRSDSRGRFRVGLRPDRTYLVHAQSTDAEAAEYDASQPKSFKATMRLLEIRAEPNRSRRLRLRCLGLERFQKEWEILGPLQARIVTSDGLVRELSLLQEKTIFLPRLPGQQAEIQVLTKLGEVLQRFVFPLEPDAREYRVGDQRARKEQQAMPGSRFVPGLPKGDLLPTRDLEFLILPPSLELEIQVTNKETGERLAGAKILEYSASGFPGKPRRFQTDAQGLLRVRVPHDLYSWGQYRQPSSFDFLVRVPGREHSLAHFEFHIRRSPTHFPFASLFSKETPTVRCALEKGLRYKGRILTPPTFDPTAIRLRGWSSGPLSRSDDWVAFVRKPFQMLHVDKTGRFEMGGLGSDPESIRIDVVLPRDLRRLLGSKDEMGIPTQTGLSLRIDRLRNLEADFVDVAVDLNDQTYTTIEIRDPHNQPASYAMLDLQTYPGQMHRIRGEPYQARTLIHCNRRGRCSLLLPEVPFRLLIVTETAYGLVDWTGTDAPPTSPWRIQLVAKSVVRGRVVDKKGQAIARAWIQPAKLLNLPELEGLKLDHEGVRDASLEGDEFRCDAEGRFEIRYIPLYRRAWLLSATATMPGRHIPYVRFQIPPETETSELRLVLERKH